MPKVISISQETVTLGLENGSLREVRMVDLNFQPQVGDEVELYETESRIVVIKKEPPRQQIPEGGIHINVSNENQTTGVVATQVISGKVVNKVVYCILALFLGGLGVHKFYAGRIGAGICYLLFCWTCIPAFIALIEFIVALCKKSDSFGNIVV